MTKKLALTGQAQNGRSSAAPTPSTASPARAAAPGRLVAVGTVRGKLGRRSVTKRNVAMPAQLTRPHSRSGAAAASERVRDPEPQARPITLDLLGLVVRTNLINVRIDAVPGPGNLLGNLLCAITGILDPQAAATSQLAQRSTRSWRWSRASR